MIGIFEFSRQHVPHLEAALQATNMEDVSERGTEQKSIGQQVQAVVEAAVSLEAYDPTDSVVPQGIPLVGFAQTFARELQCSPLFWNNVKASITKCTPFMKQCLAHCWVTVEGKCKITRYQVTDYELSDSNHKVRRRSSPPL